MNRLLVLLAIIGASRVVENTIKEYRRLTEIENENKRKSQKSKK